MNSREERLMFENRVLERENKSLKDLLRTITDTIAKLFERLPKAPSNGGHG